MAERQQLVGDEEEAVEVGESRTSALSLSLSPPPSSVSLQHKHHPTRLAYVSERRVPRPRGPPPPCPPNQTQPASSSNSAVNKDAQNNTVQTQAALLQLLAAFRAGDVSAHHTEQLAHVRQQQDDLARLHFKLGSDPDAPAKPASARETMARLVKSLEELSTSIEHLHRVSEENNH